MWNVEFYVRGGDMFQIGIKGEQYGKCQIIEREWLRSFVDELNMVGAVMSQIHEWRNDPLSGGSTARGVVEWIWHRISAVHYAIHNYAESDVIDYNAAVGYMLSRHDELDAMTFEALAARCGCRGCRDVGRLLSMATDEDGYNRVMFVNFLRFGGRCE